MYSGEKGETEIFKTKNHYRRWVVLGGSPRLLARLVTLAFRLSISQLFKPNLSFAKKSKATTLRRLSAVGGRFASQNYATVWRIVGFARRWLGCDERLCCSVPAVCRFWYSGSFRLPRQLSQPRQSSHLLGSVRTFGSVRTSAAARPPRSVFVPRRLAVSVLVGRGRFW